MSVMRNYLPHSDRSQRHAAVRCQAGVTLADLHDWLISQAWPFSLRLQDATVGFFNVATSKQRLNGEWSGRVCRLVQSVSYVDGEGPAAYAWSWQGPCSVPNVAWLGS
jgi:hypothetical protein